MRLSSCVIAFWAATIVHVEGISVAASRRTSTQHADCVPSWIGDAICDEDNNTKECNYDGGDCCSCTCVNTKYNTCGSQHDFDCRDPNIWCKGDNNNSKSDDGGSYSPNRNDVSTSSSSSSSTSGSDYADCLTSFIGDGECDASNNNKGCNYDGGDCCECTCVDARYHCGGGELGFQCLDPEGGYCPEPTEPPTAAAEEEPTPTTTSSFKICSLVWWQGGCWPAPLPPWMRTMWSLLYNPED